MMFCIFINLKKNIFKGDKIKVFFKDKHFIAMQLNFELYYWKSFNYAIKKARIPDSTILDVLIKLKESRPE